MPELRDELRDADIPDEGGSEDRAWSLLEAEFDRRYRDERRRRSPAFGRRLAVAAAALLGVGAFAFTSAGAEVREWIGEAIDVGAPDPKPALQELPAPGSLLVENGREAIVVREDGQRRAVGDYDQVTWSPFGLYVAAVTSTGLEAVTPSGEVRWSLYRPDVADPVWSPNEGFRVAYRSGDQLRVVWGDGTYDERIDSSADVAPAWRPRTGDRNVLAYVDRFGLVRIADTDTGKVLGRDFRFHGVPVDIDWTRDGSRLMVLYPDGFRVLDAQGRDRWGSGFGSGREATGGTWTPGTEAMKVVLRERGGPTVSHVVSVARRGDDVVKRTSFTGSGHFRDPVPSPDGQWLLVAWPKADQWLFTGYGESGRSRIDAVANIRRQFGAGPGSRFPTVAGWCCQSRG